MVLGSFTETKVGIAGPLMKDHVPTPIAGEFPFNVQESWLQRNWSPPASTIDGIPFIVIETESAEALHTPLLIRHSKIYAPGIIPFTLVDELFGEIITGLFGPEIKVQLPLPLLGLFPFNVIVFVLQRAWSIPAVAKVGESSIETKTVSTVDAHIPFVIVQVNE